MAFLNKKEQVLDIELTQHGKRLLSKGKLKPVYYAFFDDDILYDGEYGGITENRSDANDRIRLDTPTTMVQAIFGGIETEVKKAIEIARHATDRLDRVSIQGTAERHYATSAPLGNSSLGEESVPAWDITFRKGRMTGSIAVLTGSYQTLKIPQLNMENVVFKTSPLTPTPGSPDARSGRLFGDFGQDGDGTVSDLNFASSRFEDGSFIKIVDDFILMEVTEDNTDNLTKNFDIEVFIEELDTNTGMKVFTPLSFDKKTSLVENDILLDQDDLTLKGNRALDPSYVDHFFHVYVDDEISKDVLCKLVPRAELEASFPGDLLDCAKDLEPRNGVTDVPGMYDSTVPEETDEDC